MKRVSHLITHVALRQSLPERAADQWVDGFTTNAGRIDEKRRERIPDEGRYKARLVDVSVKTYSQVLNPNFTSRAGLSTPEIINKHGANLEKSFKKYDRKLKHAFETVDGIPQKRFKEQVKASRTNYAEGTAARCLPFTGTRVDGLGPAPIAAFWLTKETKVEGELSSADEILEGGPFLITKLKRRPAFKAAITGRLTQAGSNIAKSTLNPAVIKLENDETNELVNGFVDPGLNLAPFTTGGASRVDYILIHEALFLEILVSRK